MKLKWHISIDNWTIGILKLRKKTYIQNKYHSKALIEQNNPLSQFLFYGIVDDTHFFISPVIMGMNRMVIVLSGKKIEEDADTKIIITVTIAPVIKNSFLAVFLWFASGISLAMFYAQEKLYYYFSEHIPSKKLPKCLSIAVIKID